MLYNLNIILCSRDLVFYRELSLTRRKRGRVTVVNKNEFDQRFCLLGHAFSFPGSFFFGLAKAGSQVFRSLNTFLRSLLFQSRGVNAAQRKLQ